MLTPALQQRINDFLPKVRVGIDFGEHAGGIAVVQGNKVLHAETYVDFHATTLELRRQLRRGRRTRHAKKMRLARLRSWVLRQRLPDGSRLPDPYQVMHHARFQVQPGIFQTPGTNPAAAPSWVDLAKQGKVDAAGFVRALTLIFQKRGFKWDAIALEEMTDSRLKDFLETARIPSDELYADIRRQIDRRLQDPQDPIRGKTRTPPDELLKLLDAARVRSPQPRIAEHRSVKEADLREVIQGFGGAAKLPTETVLRWRRELCGGTTDPGRVKPGLLNRVLRPARFENRLRSGCAWCGKPTPRKSKVRHVAYAAAVCNLRVREGRRVRPLAPSELEVFWRWWDLRPAAPGGDSPEPSPARGGSLTGPRKATPKLEGIKAHLRRLGAQEKMARQIFDLLWNDQPEGRASLCNHHLEMAAKGATMKDAGVDWQTISVRKAPNPSREQHDARVLRRLEQILFKPGATGQQAWRHGPVQFITLEAPVPETERARKGEQKPRKLETFMERLAKETGGLCIYCDRARPRPVENKDHVYPQSRGGPDVWDNLVPACKACNDEKGDRTPFEWLGGPSSPRWAAFALRVEDLAVKGVPVPPEDGGEKRKDAAAKLIRISDRKRALLLSPEPDYPENPTPLAHVGARPRQFVVALRALFKKYGVEPPRADYQLGEPFVQRAEGRLTSQLRKSWLLKADGKTANFPVKDPWDLLNHAQDAALIAACPPHTWRDTIFCYRAVRPKYAGEGRFVWAEQDGLALPGLAPDWAEYIDRRTWPLVRVLGRYPVGWKHTFADQNFYQDPDKLDDKRLRQHVPLAAFQFSGRGPDQARHPGESRMASEALDKQFRAVAQSMGLKKRQTLPAGKLNEDFPGVRHVIVEKQPGGKLARVHPEDGPPRKVQLKKASEAVVFWVPKGKPLPQLAFSVRWPRPFQKFGVPRHDPALPVGAEIIDVWKRYKAIWLDQTTGQEPGFYRVKEFTASAVTVLPENAVTDELARRLMLKRPKAAAGHSQGKNAKDQGAVEPRAPSADQQLAEAGAELREIDLHRKDIVAYFEGLRSRA
jgi:hypothetical protein